MGVPVPNSNDGTDKQSLAEVKKNTPSDNDPLGPGPNKDEKPKEKTEAELAAEKLYEENIEEEYAKREGGA